MNLPPREKLLWEVYRIYDAFIAEFDLACKQTCATCCTCNITATSLETRLILRAWEAAPERDRSHLIEAARDAPRFQPKMTINQLADLCAKGLDIPDENAGPPTKGCPLLLNDICQIYEARPFGCRAMVSQTDCAVTGEADMPDYILTVNNVFMQYIEAVDANNVQGNLIDMLLFMKPSVHASPCLPTNRPLSILMVPPEHRNRLGPLLNALSRAHETLSQPPGVGEE